VVWKARRKSDGRLVAVKQLKQSPESWEACKQLPEVRAAASISDRRHLVQLLEAVRHGGELFLVFEYIEGSLHHCIAAARRVEESQVRWAARRLLLALAAVHAAGLVHCDVKPENILVGGSEGGSRGAPTMKLCDFGQSGPAGEIATYVGTRWYRAPELFLGSRGDSSVDLWAAGCTIAELVLRRPWVPGSDTRDMLFRICGELGAPDDAEGWPLASQLMEASGRKNAEPAAWQSLRDAGASQPAVDLLEGLLRYDGNRRIRCDRALRELPFFAADEPEVPVPVPVSRPLSPATMQRSREEAQAVERRLFDKRGGLPPPPPSAPRGSSPSPPAPSHTQVSKPHSDGAGVSIATSPEPTTACGEPSSEDEALAEAFWNSCKQGAPPAPAAPGATTMLSSRTARTRVPRRAAPAGLSMAPRSTSESPAPRARSAAREEAPEDQENEDEEARHGGFRSRRTAAAAQPAHGT